MSVKVTMQPTSVIKTRLGIQKGGPAHAFLTQSCYKHMSSFVPGGPSGIINQIIDISIDKIVYQHPGAHYLYTGILYVDPKYKKGAFYSSDYGYWSRPGITKVSGGRPLNYHTPGTGSQWDKRMWTSQGDTVISEVQKYIDRGCKK